MKISGLTIYAFYIARKFGQLFQFFRNISNSYHFAEPALDKPLFFIYPEEIC